MKDYYTVTEAAKICKTSIWTLHRRIKENAIKSFRAGGGRKFLISRDDLIEFLKTNNIPIDESLSPTKIKILIVDDDEKLIRSLKRYFAQKDNIEVKIVASGFEAGVELKNFIPNIILLDIMLGDIDGRELLKTLQKDPVLKKVKVIAISGFIKDEEVKSLIDMGFSDYIAKPFKLTDLIKKVLKVLGKSYLLPTFS